jgi:hypothetical protein
MKKFLLIILGLVIGNTAVGRLILSRMDYLYPGDKKEDVTTRDMLLVSAGSGPIGLYMLGFFDRAQRISWAKGPWRWYDNSVECHKDATYIIKEAYGDLKPQ